MAFPQFRDTAEKPPSPSLHAYYEVSSISAHRDSSVAAVLRYKSQKDEQDLLTLHSHCEPDVMLPHGLLVIEDDDSALETENMPRVGNRHFHGTTVLVFLFHIYALSFQLFLASNECLEGVLVLGNAGSASRCDLQTLIMQNGGTCACCRTSE